MKHYAHTPRIHSSDNIKDNLAAARSRASKRGLPATLMMDGWRCLTAFFENVCAYCGDKWEEVEHATPLCRGGGTTIANCLPTCEDCNGKKHRRTLEDLLVKDLWPHRTVRLKRALGWLQLHGRTPINPSGSPSHLSLEVQQLVKLRAHENAAIKPWGPNVWFGLDADVIDSLRCRGLVRAFIIDGQKRPVSPYRMEGQYWKVHLTEAGRGIEILHLTNEPPLSTCCSTMPER